MCEFVCLCVCMKICVQTNTNPLVCALIHVCVCVRHWEYLYAVAFITVIRRGQTVFISQSVQGLGEGRRRMADLIKADGSVDRPL